MVNRVLLLCVGVAALSSCPPAGTSCGRGRCPTGSCIDAVTTYVDQDQLELDWWCAVPCPGNINCPGTLCLQSPIQWWHTVCGGDQLEVKYSYLSGTTIAGETLASFDIIGAPAGDGGVVHCPPDQICNAGWIHSGEPLPRVVGTTRSGMAQEEANGTPGEAYLDGGMRGPLGPLLPTGVNIVVHLGGTLEPLGGQ
jgi:hypothetical protein